MPPAIEPHLRRLRLLLKVIETGNLLRAAALLHVTPSTVTKAVQKIESEAGVALLERTHKGAHPTACGAIVARRAERALEYVDAAEAEIAAAHGGPTGAQGLASRVTNRHLSAVAAIADHQTEASAAVALSVAAPTITAALREIEQLVGQPLFLRTPRGMVVTACGEIVVRHAKLTLREIESANADLAAHHGILTGRVVVGVLPSAGTQLVARALTTLLREHSHLHVTVVDGTFAPLMHGLRCGDIDVIVGTMSHPTPTADMNCSHLVDDAIRIVARADHPLAGRGSIDRDELARAEWVVPRWRTPTRMALQAALEALGVELTTGLVECNSLPTVLGLLMESDRLSVMTSLQLAGTSPQGSLVALPITLPSPALQLGAGTRADAIVHEGTSAFIEALKAVALDFERRLSGELAGPRALFTAARN